MKRPWWLTTNDNREVALAVDECLGTLGQAEDGDKAAVHSPHTVGEAHAAEASNHLLWVDEAGEVAAQDSLDDTFQTAIPAMDLSTTNWLGTVETSLE